MQGAKIAAHVARGWLDRKSALPLHTEPKSVDVDQRVSQKERKKERKKEIER